MGVLSDSARLCPFLSLTPGILSSMQWGVPISSYEEVLNDESRDGCNDSERQDDRVS